MILEWGVWARLTRDIWCNGWTLTFRENDNDGHPYSLDFPDQDTIPLAANIGMKICHPDTDGTIDCSVCGKTRSEFRNEADDYLSERLGDDVMVSDEYLLLAQNPEGY